jgi:hypothetical protein
MPLLPVLTTCFEVSTLIQSKSSWVELAAVSNKHPKKYNLEVYALMEFFDSVQGIPDLCQRIKASPAC